MTAEAAAPLPGDSRERPASKGGVVYAALKEAILSGVLPPGAPVAKAALCAQLGVSRAPVAAALSRLAFERLVTVAPQHGSFVTPISMDDVRECMLVRRAVEAETAALAAERRPAGLVEALDRLLRYQGAAADAGDAPGLYALDVAFHDAILASLHLRQAAAILDGLRARLERIRRLNGAPPGRAAAVVAGHRTVRDAIAAGAPDGARAAMTRHLTDTAALFERFAAHDPAFFSDPR